jgi:hypothetical protein
LRVGQSEGVPLRGYARLVGAPNCAPSLCSVAGLLLALALKSRYEDPLQLPSRHDREAMHAEVTDLGGAAIEPQSNASPRTNDSAPLKWARERRDGRLAQTRWNCAQPNTSRAERRAQLRICVGR